MQSSLGVYIENKVIKYAKLQKDKDAIKVEAYNVAFYDNDLESTLKKIISETYSYKIPISINITDEMYQTFEVSTLLNKQDTKKAIALEYDMLCEEKGYNKSSLEHRYLLVEQRENPERQKAISVITNKKEISKKIDAFEGNKINTITPITTSIANLVNIDGRENILIVNIEEKTKLTTIIDGQIYEINVLNEGMGTILDNIDKVENSLTKSYDVCKNMTIYTQNASELYSENSEYMRDVTNVLSKIVTEIKRMTSQYFSNIDKIYITGMGASINNVDLYFQELIPESKCEILKPYFLNTNSMQIPIKEYIEVNSAIALALDGLGLVNKNVNFAKGGMTLKGSGNKLHSALSQEITLDSIKDGIVSFGQNLKRDFTAPLQSVDKLLLRGMVACFIVMFVYAIFSHSISKQIDKRSQQVASAMAETNKELGKVDNDIKIISARMSTYKQLIDEITNVDDNTFDSDLSGKRIIEKDSIPNLLNRIMFVIPKKVKLTSIKNTEEKHIVIHAEAEKYEQLGYLKAVLTTNGILKNVKSTPGQKVGSVVEVTIEGDLP